MARAPAFGDLAQAAGLLSDRGVLVLQVDAKTPAPALPGLVLRERRAYGRNVFLFFGML